MITLQELREEHVRQLKQTEGYLRYLEQSGGLGFEDAKAGAKARIERHIVTIAAFDTALNARKGTAR